MASAYPRFQTVSIQQLEEGSPSRAHGIDWKTELSYRKVVGSLVYQTACSPQYLKLTNFTAARAVTLFNRFYTRRSFHTHDRWHVAPACILLASKIDNSPRAVKDVAAAFFVARCIKKHKHLIQKVHDPAWVAAESQILKAAEQSVLFALNFDFSVDIPESWILPAVRAMGVAVPHQGREPQGQAEAAARALATNAYSLLASSYSCKEATILSVTHAANDVGKAALLTVCILLPFQLPLPEGSSFSEHFDVPADTLVAIFESLQHCFAPGTPGSKLTADDVRAHALRKVGAPAGAPATDGEASASEAATAAAAPDSVANGSSGEARAAEAAPAEAGAAGAATASAAAAARAGPAPSGGCGAAVSPAGAHDSASSHQLNNGATHAGRKRALECEGDTRGGPHPPKQQRQQQQQQQGQWQHHQQQQQQQQQHHQQQQEGEDRRGPSTGPPGALQRPCAHGQRR